MLRAFQWDLARQVERLDVLLELLPKYAAWGYHELYLHLEDAVDYPSLPGVARNDAYSWDDFKLLVSQATEVGLDVVPIVNLLGHTQYLIKTEEWRDLNELRDGDGAPLAKGQICPLHPRIPELVSRLLDDVAPFCTAGKVHVGLDESFHLGKCPACRAEVKRVGLAGHFARHVQRLEKAVTARGLRLGLWADMAALLPECIPQLPPGVIAYDWYYYPFDQRPRMELYGFREYDLAPALKKRGIEYWGCPMSGAFRYEPMPIFTDRLDNIESWWRRCHEIDAAGMLITSWEPDRLALRIQTTVDAAAARLWLDGKQHSHEKALGMGLAQVFGPRHRRQAPAALQADQYPFSGYLAWESLQRWDGASLFPSPSAAERACRSLPEAPQGPPVWQATILFRRTLARREVFLEECRQSVIALRQTASADAASCRERVDSLTLEAIRAASRFADVLLEGHRAAESLWRDSRSKPENAPNLRILRDDGRRLLAWMTWLAHVRVAPEQAFTASPVFGKWRLSFVITLSEPAVQRVAVETKIPSVGWVELAARHTIEFQAYAAQPEVSLTLPFSVSIENPEQPLRITIHGIGRVTLQEIRLENGVETRRGRMNGKETLELGEAAPHEGWPRIQAKTGEVELRFSEIKKARQ